MSNDALLALTKHYERLKGQTYTVPGVTKADGTPLVIHFDPPTAAQGASVRQRAGRTDEAKITLYTVIELSKNPDGTRMFSDDAETVQALSENIPGRILTGIATAIMTVTTVKDLGNS